MLLRVEDLSIDYRTPRGPVHAVDKTRFEVPKGAVVGVVGESGCGKTTAVRAIMGVMANNAGVTGGRIMFEDRDLLALSPAEKNALLWRELAYIPQSAMNSLDPVYRVGRQLDEVLIDRGGYSKSDARARARELFAMVGLDEKRLRDYPHQFSGGMRQRAAIALALALEPKLVIADEPVTALDVVIQRQILDTLNNLQDRLHLSVVLVTHDISVVAYTCNYVVVMYAGKVVEAGPVGTVLAEPAHPYTMGLCNAFPDLLSAGGRLVPIEGAPPDLSNPPSGCRFKERCPFAIADCAREPVMTELMPGHRAACWRMSEAGQLRPQAAESSLWEAMAERIA